MAKKTKKNICLEDCSALCCRYFAMDINKPRTNWDIDDLKWKLKYENIKTYIVNKRWNLLIISKCMYLKDDNTCRIYEIRPDVCRQHSPGDCEKGGKWYDVLISTPEEFDEYLKKEKSKKKRAKAYLKKKTLKK